MAGTDRKAPFAYEGLDRVMHEKARLGILTSLIGHPRGLAFGDLQRLCALTQGNLSRHLAVLEEAGLVSIEKAFEGRRPRTDVRLTAEGHRRFLAYLDVLEQVVSDAAARSGNSARTSRSRVPRPA